MSEEFRGTSIIYLAQWPESDNFCGLFPSLTKCPEIFWLKKEHRGKSLLSRKASLTFWSRGGREAVVRRGRGCEATSQQHKSINHERASPHRFVPGHGEATAEQKRNSFFVLRKETRNRNFFFLRFFCRRRKFNLSFCSKFSNSFSMWSFFFSLSFRSNLKLFPLSRSFGD